MVQTHRLPCPVRRHGASRGAASLVVVMILFFIITLVAAYTSRNLLFEQRTSANQYRGTLAFETADAGIEWAIARLNEGRMNDDCTELGAGTPVASPPQPSFRERYLTIDATTGVITAPDKLAGCAFNGTAWVCHCPDAGNPAPTVVTTGAGPFPAFWVKFRHDQIDSRPGVVRIQVNACTRNDAACLNFAREAQSGDGLATVWSMVALRSAMPTAPVAALTVRGAFLHSAGTPSVTNSDPVSGGFTIHASGAVNAAAITLASVPGSPPERSVWQGDNTNLSPTITIGYATPANDGREWMFNSVFGTWSSTYLGQPGVAVVDCTGGCDAGDVNAVVARQPGHTIHVSGGGTLSVDADIGSVAAPVVLISEGSVEFTGAPTLFGLVYARGANWAMRGNGTLRGAAIAERDFEFATDNPAIVYDRALILLQQHRLGTFAKVPGSWRDFQPEFNP